jgi:hypothetical protein
MKLFTMLSLAGFVACGGGDEAPETPNAGSADKAMEAAGDAAADAMKAAGDAMKAGDVAGAVEDVEAAMEEIGAAAEKMAAELGAELGKALEGLAIEGE